MENKIKYVFAILASLVLVLNAATVMADNNTCGAQDFMCPPLQEETKDRTLPEDKTINAKVISVESAKFPGRNISEQTRDKTLPKDKTRNSTETLSNEYLSNEYVELNPTTFVTYPEPLSNEYVQRESIGLISKEYLNKVVKYFNTKILSNEYLREAEEASIPEKGQLSNEYLREAEEASIPEKGQLSNEYVQFYRNKSSTEVLKNFFNKAVSNFKVGMEYLTQATENPEEGKTNTQPVQTGKVEEESENKNDDVSPIFEDIEVGDPDY